MAPNDDYDKLTPEEREARDKADRAREAAEQAGAALCFDRPLERVLYRHVCTQRCRTSGLSSSEMSMLLCLSPRVPEGATLAS